MSKVHYTINPPCKVANRWGSSQITSCKCLDYVTCGNCLRIVEARYKKEHPAVSEAMDLFGMGFQEYIKRVPKTIEFTVSDSSNLWAGGVK